MSAELLYHLARCRDQFLGSLGRSVGQRRQLLPAGTGRGARRQRQLEPGSTLTSDGEEAGDPVVGMRPGGNAVALWEVGGSGQGCFIQASARPAHGSWGPVVTLSPVSNTEVADFPKIGMGANGNAVAIWVRPNQLFDPDRLSAGWELVDYTSLDIDPGAQRATSQPGGQRFW
jgi:hypothetical protein